MSKAKQLLNLLNEQIYKSTSRYTSKPITFDEINKIIKVSADTGKLPIFLDTQVFGKIIKNTKEVIPNYDSKFSKNLPDYFILSTYKAGDYIVNTQGFNYIRYIARLVR